MALRRRTPYHRTGGVWRFIWRTALTLVLSLVGAVGAALWWSLPPAHLVAALPALDGPVRITFDNDGIPLIRAGSARDGAMALGFVHARDRMFQMDLVRRTAAGRLSELTGAATVPLDKTMRTLGLGRRAVQDLDALTPVTRSILDAYAAGVNAWITRRGRFAAPEFIVLGQPEPWTASDCLLWGKTMALYLSGNWRTEMARAAMVRDGITPGWDPLPTQPDVARPDAGLPLRWADAIPAFPAPFTQPGTASNEWAVDGTHSETGAPLLAGDPHLAFTMPSLWYLARIETPAGVLAGATAPGVPFLIIGHNGRIAWTFTTTGADTQDVFVEAAAPGGQYQTPDGPRPFVTRTERIRVLGAPEILLTVRETRHGPVLSDLEPEGGPVLAVAMAGLQPDSSADGLAALNRAADVDEAGAAAARITAPVQNMLVADRTRIAQFMTGLVPIRRAGDGSVPVPGADGAHDWTGYASGLDLPHIVAPASGRIVNANERVAPPDYPVFLGRDWNGDWRARRIRGALLARQSHSVESFAALQLDRVSTQAQQVLPALMDEAIADPGGLRALLRGWDGQMDRGRPQPLIYNAWMRAFSVTLLASARVPPGAAGYAPDVTAQALLDRRACGGDCTAALTSSLADARASLAVYGSDPAAWRWGPVHQARFAHPILGRLPLVGGLFTWSIDHGGDGTTVDRGGLPGAGPLRSIHGAGFRGVYDLADLDRSVFAMTPGQSGHPLRAQAGSLMSRWRDGDSLFMGPTQPNVAETMELAP